MLACGCQYKPFEKSYYNDTHERHDNQLDRVTKATRYVGAFPPNGGTPEYVKAKEDVESKHDWYEYHTDFLPEELAHQLNGGFVSQRCLVKLPCAAPRNNGECIKRLSDLLTTSCPQTQLLLQKEIDRIVVGSDIKYVFVLLACRMHTHTRTHTHTHPRTHTHTGKNLALLFITVGFSNATFWVWQQMQNRAIMWYTRMMMKKSSMWKKLCR